MPSPFPGMDPFLEDPAVFPDLHDSLIVYLREALNSVLPSPYYAGIASRVWIEESQRRIGPDVKVLHLPVNGGVRAGNGGGGVAVAEAVRTEPVAVEVELEEQRETFLAIYSQPGAQRVVTTIEILSPANKTPAGHGRTPYLQKQREVLQSQVHLVEIDLLRAGVHTTAVPHSAAVAKAGAFDYHVCVHRWDRPNWYYVYPIQLQGRLPVVTLPLLPDDPPVDFDLRAILDRAYDAGQYHHWVPYREKIPAPPLYPNQTAWVHQTLRAAGLIESPAAGPTA
jgi:Protein of unknown function (DUF4058)